MNAPSFHPRNTAATIPIIGYHRERWLGVTSGTLGPEFTNSAHAAARVHGTLDIAALESSVKLLVSRHSILQAKVVDTDAGPQFAFDGNRRFITRLIDLRSTEHSSRESVAQRAATDAVFEPFAENEAWLRVFVLRLSESESVIGLVIHHFIADGWSVGLAVGELFTAYAAFAAGSEPVLPLLRLQYSDYVQAINQWFDAGAAEPHAAYWRERLRNAPPTRIPADFQVEPDAAGAVLTQTLQICAEDMARVRGVCNTCKLSMHVMVLAALSASLAHYGKSEDIVIVTRVSGRVSPAIFGLIGAFFDAVAIRLAVTPHQPFLVLAQQAQQTLVQAQAHQVYPFQLVKESLQHVGASTIAPMINFTEGQAGQAGESSHPALRLERFQLLPRPVETHRARRYSAFYMPVRIDPTGLHAKLDYLSLMYRPETMTAFAATFCRILSGAGADPSRTLASLIGT